MPIEVAPVTDIPSSLDAGQVALSGPGVVNPTSLDIARALQEIARDLGERYRLLGYLGHGAFATVWQARDQITGDLVAIKRFNPRVGPGPSFYRELSVLFRLQHPRVARIVNLSERAQGARYLILEHCAGGTLRTALARAQSNGEVCPPERARAIACQLAEGLAVAHAEGIAHRDLKPANILFAEAALGPFGGNSEVKLADFGLARALEAAEGADDQPLRALSGSPAYMAPEQFEGSFGASSDLYALGVVLYELLHGHLPFEGSPEALAYQHLRAQPAINPKLPRPWPALLTALLDKQFSRRITAEQLLAKLRVVPTRGSLPGTVRDGWDVQGAEARNAFGLFTAASERGTDLVVVSSDHLVRFKLASGKPSGGVPLPQVSRATLGPEGRLWFARGGEVLRLGEADVLTTVLDLEGTIDALAPGQTDGREDCVVARGDELSAWPITDDRPGGPLWSTNARISGLRPCLLRLADGRLVFAEGPINPRLVCLGHDGRPERTVSLPGLCWHLIGGPDSLVHARLLVGNQFQAARIDLSAGRCDLLAGAEDIVLLAAAPEVSDRIHGLRADGNVVRWRADGRRDVPLQLTFPDATFRSLATDGLRLAVLVRQAGRCSLHVRTLPAESGDEGSL